MYDPDDFEFDHERRRNRDSGIPSNRTLTIWSLIWFLSVLLFAVFLFGFTGNEAQAQTQGFTGFSLDGAGRRVDHYSYGLSTDTQVLRYGAQTLWLSNQVKAKPRQSYPAYPWEPKLKPRVRLRGTVPPSLEKY